MTTPTAMELSRRALLAMALPAVAATATRAQDNGKAAAPDAAPAAAPATAPSNDAEDYPNRPVTFIVPFAPSGGTDILARLLGQKLEQGFGKPFVVENRPGAGTVIATNFVAKSRPTATRS